MPAKKAKSVKTGRLGKGLSSLMGSPSPRPVRSAADPSAPERGGKSGAGEPDESFAEEVAAGPVRLLRPDQIVPNRHQPRQRMDQGSLKSLTESIRLHGVMQPIVVRPMPHAAAANVSGSRYELVAGERRWRAAQELGLEEIPVVVAELDDQQLAEWALVENLQREDLNPIDRAEAFQRLAELFHLPHEAIATRVGLERSTVTNLLRLLDLSDYVQGLVRDDLLSMGQARAIAGVDDPAVQRTLAQRAVKEGMSVRQVEAAVRTLARGDSGGGGDTKTQRRGNAKLPYLEDLERQIADHLGTKVHLKASRKKGAGSMTIEFYSLDQFDALLDKLGVEAST